jgi:hypothetical protein
MASAYKHYNKWKIARDAWSATKTGYLKRLLTNTKSRSRRDGIQYDLPHDHFLTLWDNQKGLCAVTGLPLQHSRQDDNPGQQRRCNDFNASADRIDPFVGYVEGNVRLVCWFVNHMKGQRSDEEFKFLVDILHASMAS